MVDLASLIAILVEYPSRSTADWPLRMGPSSKTDVETLGRDRKYERIICAPAETQRGSDVADDIRDHTRCLVDPDSVSAVKLMFNAFL